VTPPWSCPSAKSDGFLEHIARFSTLMTLDLFSNHNSIFLFFSRACPPIRVIRRRSNIGWRAVLTDGFPFSFFPALDVWVPSDPSGPLSDRMGWSLLHQVPFLRDLPPCRYPFLSPRGFFLPLVAQRKDLVRSPAGGFFFRAVPFRAFLFLPGCAHWLREGVRSSLDTSRPLDFCGFVGSPIEPSTF